MLQHTVEEYYELASRIIPPPSEDLQQLKQEILQKLNTGALRAAIQAENGDWEVVPWIKKAILLIFKTDRNAYFPGGFYDRENLKLRSINNEEHNIRVVPGGTAIRQGSHIGKNVVIMPPSYVNIGVYVDEGSMIDSHVLLGSCAQIGKRVHVSAGAIIGGVLEPVGSRPVIIEDDVMIGGQAGIYEGVLVKRGAVISTGTILNNSTKVYDIIYDKIYQGTEEEPLVIPAGAVVVSGSRKIGGDFGEANGLSIATPLIVKYRDDRTDAKIKLNQDLRR